MENERPPIDYEPRKERLALGEWWAKAPRRFTLVAVLVGNCALCMLVNFLLGGDAIGTMPSAQGYVLKSHGHFTHVTQNVWLFSLIYTACTLLITPNGIVAVLASLARGLFDGRAPVFRGAFVLCLIMGPWTYAIIRDSCCSSLDFCHLSAAWPAVAWLLRGITVAALALLAVASVREGRQDRELWARRWGTRLNAVRPLIRRE